MLEVAGLTTKYGAISALREASLCVQAGEVIGLIGPNGAGKTTLLNTIAGLLKPATGTVTFNGESIVNSSPESIVRAGMALVPEHRRLFADMSIEENLRIGGITRTAAERDELLTEMAELFPVLADKWSTAAGFLSGGEGQQLAIARALMSKPKLLLMDEPSLGLAPILVDLVFDLIDQLKSTGRTLLVVEQNATRMLGAADRAYVLRSGEVVADGTGEEVLSRDDLFDSFVGTNASNNSVSDDSIPNNGIPSDGARSDNDG